MNRICPNCKKTFYSVEIDTKGCDHCGWPCHQPAQLAEPERLTNGVDEGACDDDETEPLNPLFKELTGFE